MPFSKLHEEVAWQIEVLEVHRLKAPRNPSLAERAGILLGKQESRDSHLGSVCPDPNISDSSCSGSGFFGFALSCHGSPLEDCVANEHQRKRKGAQLPDLEYLQEF